ncbi:TetR/AcrR family transcriptional regulator [Lactiplantibacillus pentosus]|nr:TetR family transcriptional regulator [Lactiplantibacillus pentosus]MBQ0837032.1 TetR/AcrR family transcriptional regulator [Lactiplantibacillus pentosus]MBU7465621.1 TetR/AcrR family transcriptional regulator [Lactiplantibacillus pentosus]MBU7490417.1 TetR/AcrR family transcriptional regulator [Lactiplantibacillus pentosus]MBU7494706.1 TetR/AcrR family transcriptional regulator [Lactiplantibacillus pentosus]MBU7520735.1 TetR/AcrR family transcriptional regulator [Lactiplantibacillus pentos
MKRGTLTRLAVLQQAEALVAQDGFSKLTYNGLARQCGVKPQSLYRYVANIADVKSGVIGLYIQQLIERIQTQLHEETGQNALLHGAELFLTEAHNGISFIDMIAGIVEYGENEQVRTQITALRSLFGQYIIEITTNPAQATSNEQLFFEAFIGNIVLFNTHDISTQDGVRIMRQNLARLLTLF